MKKSDISSLFSETLRRPLEESVPLKEYSHFRIGGNADYFFEAFSSSEFIEAVRFSRDQSIPFYIIGGGYNILFDDRGFRGLIIKNSAKGISWARKDWISVLSGTPLHELLQFGLKREMGGLEFLAGIPGTLGGAVFSNAGAFDQSIGDFLRSAALLTTQGEEIFVKKDYFAFSYRQSTLKKTHLILLKAVLKVANKPEKEIKALMDENLENRKKKHPPWDVACAGSYFKNPVLPSGEKAPAAYLLDKVGVKDLSVGEAVVYSDHANFILNKGNASAQDVQLLASEMKKRVREKFDVDLEEEVIFLPASFSMP